MRTILFCALLSASATSAATFPVSVSVNTVLDTHAISPYIYGSNADLTGAENFTARRQGGNRLTGYNWENNYSSAGTDWNNSSDNYLPSVMGIPDKDALTPGIVVTAFIDSCRKYHQFPLVTFQMAGYVSRDKKGTVAASEVAPSARWRSVVAHKPSAFAATPDTSDNAVYMDELMNFLKSKYGTGLTPLSCGISLDNEPTLWPSTHPLIHPAKPTCQEIIDRSVALSTAIKNVDNAPLIFGPVSYGFGELTDFQGAADWGAVKGNCTWFVEWYLDKMKQASQTAGKRLLDVFDIHWYSEATGNGERIVGASNPGNRANAEARLQAPRTLWDKNYVENSWIGQWFSSYLPLIPKLQAAVKTYNPGTRLAFTEYNYGGENHISGGLAMADVFGIYGKYDLYLATYWQMDSKTAYTSSAYKLYRNYDGKNGAFGDLSVRCGTNDSVRSSAYAATVPAANKELHLVLINKNFDSTMNATVTIAGGTTYQSMRIWGFDSTSSTIKERLPAPAIANNTFTYAIPPLSACHVVVTASATVRRDRGALPSPLAQSDRGYALYSVLGRKVLDVPAAGSATVKMPAGVYIGVRRNGGSAVPKPIVIAR
jgi:mannan endo-1,4-beta-mannosidase